MLDVETMTGATSAQLISGGALSAAETKCGVNEDACELDCVLETAVAARVPFTEARDIPVGVEARPPLAAAPHGDVGVVGVPNGEATAGASMSTSMKLRRRRL